MASKLQPIVVFLCLSSIFVRQSAAGQCPMSGTSSGRRSLKQAGPSLQFGFYSSSCPSLDNIVSDKITWYTNEDGSTPAKLLRLFFHDCVAGGCEASILLNSNGAGPAERDAPISATLEKFNVIDDIKATVEAQCPGIVSCADILALAAVHSVRLAGGPTFSIDLGRRDGWNSYASTATSFAPLSTFKVDALLTNFGNIGLDQTDLVALSGAHTIGEIHCTNFADRYQGSSPFPDWNFGNEMYNYCSNYGASPDFATLNRKTFMETLTPNFFDAQYFVALTQGRGMMTSDQELYNDWRTRPLVEAFAADRNYFFDSFVSSMQKMGRLGVITGTDGVIRKQCWASP
ncbi:hypothetical protein M758_12G023400 [Ceratodon purpureus]|nr:hypothetical protein M758_12G023400 [Ceratodon purpureus]